MEGSKTGKGGKSFQDRELAAKVRTLALSEIEKVLSKGNVKSNPLFQPVLLKLSGTVLPRLNEHSGEGGEPIQLAIAGMNIIKEDDEDTRKDNRVQDKKSKTAQGS